MNLRLPHSSSAAGGKGGFLRSNATTFQIFSWVPLLCVLCVSALSSLPLLLFSHFPRLQLLRFPLIQQPVSPSRNPFHRQRPQPHPHHLLHRMVLAKHQMPQLLQLRALRPHLIPIIRHMPAASIRLPQRLHLNPNLFSQPLQIRKRKHPLDLHVIHLLNLLPLLQHLRRQIPVVRQKHQSRSRILQIPHRIHPFRKSPQQIPQILPPLRISQRRNHLRGFVHQHVYRPALLILDRPPRRLNLVFLRISFAPKLRNDSSVHHHLPGKNQLLRMTPRSTARSAFLPPSPAPHVPETVPPPKVPSPRAQSLPPPKRANVDPALPLRAPHPLPDATPQPALP